MRHLHMNGILLDLPSGKIICVHHKVGSVFRVYGAFASVFAFPCEIKQTLGSTETQCIKMHKTELRERQDLHQPNKLIHALT